ncbi:MAG: YsnF/AvaK domain-containing protein [Arachnia sp.]
MINHEDIDRLLNGKASVLDREGEKVGSLSQIYLDDTTGEPSWATVNTGLFGMSESFVPLEGASARGEDLHVGYSKDQIKDAPNLDEDHHLEPADEDRLYAYYANQGSGYPDQGTGRSDVEGDHGHDVADSDLQRGTVDSGVDRRTGDDDSMTLSEERVNVGTESHESGRVRLRKYVVTENVTKTVPVSHEEVRIERVPVDQERAGRIDDGGDEVEVTLHEEKAVVDKDTVAVEEVRLGKETVTEQQTVNTEVRKEHLDTDDDTRHDR